MKKTAIAEVVGETASTAATNRASDKFVLRLPGGMREHLARVAEREGRSMNSVVVTALAAYFESEDAPKKSGFDVEAVIRFFSEGQQQIIESLDELKRSKK
jgi:hypothetical protein